MKYRNPVIPGFHPDPSICRAGNDYYLATSSFEYFPGVPVFHSKDLAHWRQIGHCLTRRSQLDLTSIHSSGGIFAPALRYHDGLFYMISTVVGGRGHFIVTAQDPAGEWSDPVWVEGKGFDPDLFFDDDGKVYFQRHDNGEGIYQREIDVKTGALAGEERWIWKGFEDKYCEGPHLYKINGLYYLIAAEGSTHRGHMVVAARSSKPTGPFEGCPHNPILTHRCKLFSPIQAAGHGDLICAHDGSWWMVFLGIRQIGWGFHHLGRETFLAPVTWTEDGWPVVNGGKPVELVMDAGNLTGHPWPPIPVRDDFDGQYLGLAWNFRRNPGKKDWSLSERPGCLRLTGTSLTLDDMNFSTFIGRRQEHFECTVSALVDFQPQTEGEEAGLTVLMNEEHHYEIAVTREDGSRQVMVRRRIGDLQKVVAREPAPEGPVILQITTKPHYYHFEYGREGEPPCRISTAATRYLAQEVAGGFTGVYFGMYATGNGIESRTPAYFDWFEYEPDVSPA
ncbi:MAG: glycoside hydrolase family 43 protein [Bacillota bacterium]